MGNSHTEWGLSIDIYIVIGIRLVTCMGSGIGTSMGTSISISINMGICFREKILTNKSLVFICSG